MVGVIIEECPIWFSFFKRKIRPAFHSFSKNTKLFRGPQQVDAGRGKISKARRTVSANPPPPPAALTGDSSKAFFPRFKTICKIQMPDNNPEESRQQF